MSFGVVRDFEYAIAKFYGAPYAVAVDSCTHSIELCLRYKDVKTPKTKKAIKLKTKNFLRIELVLKKLDFIN